MRETTSGRETSMSERDNEKICQAPVICLPDCLGLGLRRIVEDDCPRTAPALPWSPCPRPVARPAPSSFSWRKLSSTTRSDSLAVRVQRPASTPSHTSTSNVIAIRSDTTPRDLTRSLCCARNNDPKNTTTRDLTRSLCCARNNDPESHAPCVAHHIYRQHTNKAQCV